MIKNYEELLAVTSLDAVIIATPPHWHALQLIAALGRGLDVFIADRKVSGATSACR